jgi:hypothetical protein
LTATFHIEPTAAVYTRGDRASELPLGETPLRHLSSIRNFLHISYVAMALSCRVRRPAVYICDDRDDVCSPSSPASPAVHSDKFSSPFSSSSRVRSSDALGVFDVNIEVTVSLQTPKSSARSSRWGSTGNGFLGELFEPHTLVSRLLPIARTQSMTERQMKQHTEGSPGCEELESVARCTLRRNQSECKSLCESTGSLDQVPTTGSR